MSEEELTKSESLKNLEELQSQNSTLQNQLDFMQELSENQNESYYRTKLLNLLKLMTINQADLNKSLVEINQSIGNGLSLIEKKLNNISKAYAVVNEIEVE